MSPGSKRRRTQAMAERCISGEYGGSSWNAAMSPITAKKGISRGVIQHRMDQIDPDAFAARATDRERVRTEVAAAEAAGHCVKIVFAERGGSASAQKTLTKLTAKLQGGRFLFETLCLPDALEQGTGQRPLRQRPHFKPNLRVILWRKRGEWRRGFARMRRVRWSSPISRPASRPRKSGQMRRRPRPKT